MPGPWLRNFLCTACDVQRKDSCVAGSADELYVFREVPVGRDADMFFANRRRIDTRALRDMRRHGRVIWRMFHITVDIMVLMS